MIPLIYTRTIGPFSHREAPVSLVRAPWDGQTATPDPRPETAPPRGIKGHQHRMTPQEVVDAIRREWVKTRASA